MRQNREQQGVPNSIAVFREQLESRSFLSEMKGMMGERGLRGLFLVCGMGDAARCVQYASVVLSVLCALYVQRTYKKNNAQLFA
jgi:hypothetical protein